MVAAQAAHQARIQGNDSVSDRWRWFAGVGMALVSACVGACPRAAGPRPGRAIIRTSSSGFRLESGATLPTATLVYATYGHLEPSTRQRHFCSRRTTVADHHGYDWLIGPTLALDTTRYFLIATEMFGNGHSSSPSNTPEPFHGPRFPVTTIRDNVGAVAEMLSSLGITHLKAVIGFSMGAEQAFQWAVSHPSFMDRIVATSGTAKCYGHGVVRLEGQIAALEADENFRDGDYTQEPIRGLRSVRHGVGPDGCSHRNGGVGSCGEP